MTRFYVHEMSGCEITLPVAQRSTQRRPVPRACYVLDSAYVHQPVAVFPLKGQWTAGGKRLTEARRAAAAKAAELNEWDAALGSTTEER